ncbi:putative PrkA-type serine/threonine protein kinase [Natrialba magadii ATCC 43099]|uniref:PrkA-type serine/threonine protein kinase n=1 Tax=Natrialba magadii (strain ATCC 43099 / DSM 3394 / CCM 3739 / CIP 104546 / IAM 13178 / JCM 8861 / NBRC 102185 / NCIMB 2190 / MS3) TaxID=547559 RepID=D3SSS3_NATMM|nr:serine protein kinase PrkA [Natrialba magadii]ADD06918.1 putative PrkA-type serine/threonine protein kinase [Natrialba magadii ATCC 43099]ELY28458.1 serine protein kinase PrkA [Natrialba magadii ATCC 43099]
MTGNDYVSEADRELEETYEKPMALAAYVDRIFENPTIASHASKYLLEAIEAAGTRTVVEEGEEKERYRFFDDPHNDGEHAILGNTEVLNRFVDDLRSIAAGRAKDEKIIWFEGPTATGKSELKRCLVNGLREYSKTPEGRRYTIEWNVATAETSDRSLSYGVDPTAGDDQNWYQSPVQSHPLSVFPEQVRSQVLADLNEQLEDHVPVRVDTELDPFSREAYDFLEERYRREGSEDLFSAIADSEHLRVKNYVVDIGQGVGVLHSEDEGRPKERLVGSWMHGMLQELDSRGRKNPQAFSYDGVLSQGNGVLTIVEDAAQHADLLQKLLNVPDEQSVKLDKGIGMDVDTQLLIISNPDLEAQLNQHADRNGMDPLKALKRRLDKHRFGYLTNLSLETELIRRELTNETEVWEADSYDELENRIREPVRATIKGQDGRTRTREFAPHAIEAAALYAVVTRLDEEDLPNGLDLVDKALIYDQGYLQEGDTRREKDEFDFDDDGHDGDHGIPVTYTRDTLAELLQTERDRHHGDLSVEDVVMPRDVLNAMAEGMANAPVFSTGERSEFENRVVPVKNYIFDRQESDVIEAIMHEKRVDEETVGEYVEQVYAWETDEPLYNDRGERVEPDPLKMKLFEIEHLGRFSEDEYQGNLPRESVRNFRREKVITSLNRHAWEHRDEDFSVADVDLAAIPVIKSVLESHDWDDVSRTFEDFDPRQWDDPPSGTETASVKENTIETMVAEFDYSEASAELTSRHVMGQVSYRWD